MISSILLDPLKEYIIGLTLRPITDSITEIVSPLIAPLKPLVQAPVELINISGPASLVAWIALAISIVTLLLHYFGGVVTVRKEIVNSEKSILDIISSCKANKNDIINKIENRLTQNETKMELFWNAMGGVMLNLIKQPIHIEKDDLMDKLVDHPKEITREELNKLKVILDEELVELKVSKDPKVIAHALAVAYIDQIIYDMEWSCRLTDICKED